MKKNIIRNLAVSLGIATLLTGCRIGEETVDETKTNISVTVFNGTARTEYMEKAVKRFEEANKDVSFAPGKTGVHIDVDSVGTVPNTKSTLEISDSDIFLDENKPNIYSNSQEGIIMNLNEVVSPLEDKIDSDCLNRCRGYDGNYYALPHYSWYSGVTYNKTIFDEYNLYFADPNEVNAIPAIAYSEADHSKVFYEAEKVKMIANGNSKKSVGPDGVYGTYDDGLPSSLQEFAIWCANAKNKFVTPFRMAGAQPTYSMYLTHGLWSALAGEEKMKVYYQNYTSTPIEVVKKNDNGTTLTTNNELFYPGSKIYEPQTESIVINESNGYRVYDMVERYYSLAFFELLYKEKWLSSEFEQGSNDSHLSAFSDFLNGSKDQAVNRCAILYDASYWYHEAKESINVYKNLSGGEAPDVSYMPLPVKLNGSVTEKTAGEAPNKQTLLNIGSSYVYVNAKTALDEGRKAAVISFLKFLYSDDELKAFSELTGLQIPMQYTYSTENKDTYYQKLQNIVNDADVVQFASDSMIFKLNQSSFSLFYNSRITELTVKGTAYPSQSYLGPLKDTKKNITCVDLFDAGSMSASIWNSLRRSF